MKKPEETNILHIELMQRESITLCLLGDSPFIFNAMSFKAKQELLFPKGRKTASDKAVNLKHDPLQEFRSSMYTHRDDKHLTRLLFPTNAFKGAAMSAALRIPGIKKTEIGQLLIVDGQSTDMYGVPQLLMSVVRMADINHTPDIRTRAILPTWACRIKCIFVRPQLTSSQIGNLLANAGQVIGVGDYRQEKGVGEYGRFSIVSEDNPAFKSLTKTGTLRAQDAAIANPATYDAETDELFSWFKAEAKVRDREITRIVKKAG